MSTSNDDSDGPGRRAKVVIFRARAPRRNAPGYANLGSSDLARTLGAPARQGTGHWCSHCRGIWFGYPLEVACPRCGSRQG
jgi:hypothetical protein